MTSKPFSFDRTTTVVLIFAVLGAGLLARPSILRTVSGMRSNTQPEVSRRPWIDPALRRKLSKLPTGRPETVRPITAARSVIDGALIPPVSNIFPTVEGYFDQQSVNSGETVGLHASSKGASYDLVVYRIGWYGGNGAQEVLRRNARPGVTYATPAPNSFGTVDAGWPVTDSISTSGWSSGYYLAALIPSGGGTTGYAPFVVRNDASASPILVQIPFNTYQAYNEWGGKSLYDVNSTGGRAIKVSLDRPYKGGQGTGMLFNGDYQMILWLERAGYDVAYATSSDAHSRPDLMNNHKVFVTAFHDEYWSYEMRANLVNWINAGRSAAFLSANNLYYQVRYEPSSRGVANRLIVCYKSLSDPANTSNPSRTTYLFRLPPVNLPEEQIEGARYENYLNGSPYGDWIVRNAQHWIYAGTGMANGSRISGVIGYEWDRANAGVPADGTQLSASPVLASGIVYQQESIIREKASGAIVFDASTTNFAWRLMGNDGVGADPTFRQMTANLFNRIIGSAPPPTTTVAPTTTTTVAPTTTTTVAPTTTTTSATTTTSTTTTTTTTTTTAPTTTTTTSAPTTTTTPTTTTPTTTTTTPPNCSAESFEGASTPWQNWYSGTAVKSTLSAHTGGGSLRLLGTPATAQRVIDPAACHVALGYVTLWARSESGTSTFTVKMVGQLSQSYTTSPAFVLSTNWALITIPITLSEPVLVGLEALVSTGVSVYVDDVSFVAGRAATPNVPGCNGCGITRIAAPSASVPSTQPRTPAPGA